MENSESLELTVLVDVDNIIPMFRDWKTGFPRPRGLLPRSIVAHWVGAAGQTMFDLKKPSTLQWMIYERRNASYHMTISETGEIIIMVDPNYVAYHCGATKYTEKATQKYGETYCPRYEHTQEHPHKSSPNFLTIGFCMAHKNWEGEYTKETYDAAVKGVAYLFNRYAPHLDTILDLECHSDISATKNPPCPRWFFEHPEEFMKFKREVEALRFEWKEKYPNRGYPELKIKEVRVSKDKEMTQI